MRILLLVSIMSVSLISCSHLQKFMGNDQPAQGEAVNQSAYPSSPRGDGSDVIDPYSSAGGSGEAVAEMSSSVESVEHDSMQAQAAAPTQSFSNEMHEAEASPSMEMASAPAMEAAPSEMAAASQTEDMVAGPIETPKIENLDHLAREQNYVMSSPKSSYHKTEKKKSVKKVEKIAKKDKKSKKSQLLAKEKAKKSKVLAKKSSLKKDKYAKNSKAKKDKIAKNKKDKSKVAKKDKKGRAVAANKKGFKVSKQ